MGVFQQTHEMFKDGVQIEVKRAYFDIKCDMCEDKAVWFFLI